MSKQIRLTEAEINLIQDVLAYVCDYHLVYKSNEKGKAVLALRQKIARMQKRIKPSSAKAKGRLLQNWAVGKIAKLLQYNIPGDKDLREIRGREMGQAGTDVCLSENMRKRFPFAVECKNQEHISLCEFIEQAKKNTSETLPYWILILKNKMIKNPVLIMDWEGFYFMAQRYR